MNANSSSAIAKIGILEILNDMKNPLANIHLCIELIENDSQKNGGVAYLEIIKSNAKRLEGSIRELVRSFETLGITVHLSNDSTPIDITPAAGP